MYINTYMYISWGTSGTCLDPIARCWQHFTEVGPVFENPLHKITFEYPPPRAPRGETHSEPTSAAADLAPWGLPLARYLSCMRDRTVPAACCATLSRVLAQYPVMHFLLDAPACIAPLDVPGRLTQLNRNALASTRVLVRTTMKASCSSVLGT